MRRSIRGGRLLLAAAAAAILGPAGAGAQSTEANGGIYLFHYQPVDMTALEPRTEVYAAFLNVDRRVGRWHAFAQGRARDTKLRSFFPGNVWLQEAWVSYRTGKEEDPFPLVLRAGKMYLTSGRFWDGSFFGNIHYFDGLKLNPQFAVEAAGGADLGRVDLLWVAQLLLASDRVSGALPGRDLETLPNVRDEFGWTGRLTARVPGGLRLGVTAYERAVERDPGEDPSEVSGRWRVSHVSADVQFRRAGFTGYLEGLYREGVQVPPDLRGTVPASEAVYLLAGAQYDWERAHVRYNYSRVDYRDLDRQEWIHQPGLTLDLSPGLSVLAELNFWREDAGGRVDTLDRSLNLVLLLRF